MTEPTFEYARRLARVRDRMADRGHDALLLWGDPHGSLGLLAATNDIGYLADWPLRQPGSGSAMLVLPLEGDPALLVTGPQYAPAYARDRTRFRDVRRVEPTGFAAEADRVLAARGAAAESIGVVRRGAIPVGLYERLGAVFGEGRLTDATGIVRRLRMTKSEPEMAALDASAAVCDEMFEVFAETATAGVDRHAVLARMEAVARAGGTEFVTTWIASGPRGGRYPVFEPEPGAATIADGDLVVVGVQLLDDNYWGHAIRAGVAGEPTDEQRRLYETVESVRGAVLDRAAPGVDLADLHAEVRSIYADAGYEPAFRTLHGLGLRYGGPPAFPQSGTGSVPSLELRPGMVFEVHPNAWAGPTGEEFVAVGDMAAVTESGTRRLTTAPGALLRL